jgi:protein SCO1
MTRRRNTGAAVALAAAALAALGAPALAAAAPEGSPWGRDYFGNPELVTQDGEKVRFYDDLVKDRLVVVDFIYTRCTKQCGLMTANLARVKRELGDRVGKDIFFVSVSLDPRDTPEVLKRYADAFHAGPGWKFLTGKKEDVQALRAKFGDKEAVVNHRPNINVGNDRTGEWWVANALDNPKFTAVIVGGWMDPSFKGDARNRSYAEARRDSVPLLSRAETVFKEKCASCHTGQDPVGGPLAGVSERRERRWLTRWIKDPPKVIAQGDPIARALLAKAQGVPMPELALSDADVAALVDWLARSDREARAATATAR